jgi:hypothetical protein
MTPEINASLNGSAVLDGSPTSRRRWTRSVAALVAAGAMGFGIVGPATAQPQVGLVNVSVGDVTILENVNVGAAVQAAVNICGVQVGPIGVLAVQAARQGQVVVCTTDQGDQVIIQRAGDRR